VTRLFAYLIRFAVILIGYVIASLAASAFLNIMFLASLGYTPEHAHPTATASLYFSIPFVALFVAYFAFMPAAGNPRAARLAVLCAGGRGGRGGLPRLRLPDRRCQFRDHRSARRRYRDRLRHGRRHFLLAERRALGRELAASRKVRAYFAWAVRILSAKAENTPANR
jgi:hypothetical protein